MSDVERVGVPQVYPARGDVAGRHEPGVFPHDGGSAGTPVEPWALRVHRSVAFQSGFIFEQCFAIFLQVMATLFSD